MKQLIMLISFVFLFCNISTAQKNISKTDFENFVDYANSKYVEAFIEENDSEKSYYKDTYIKNIKPKLEKATLNNSETILTFPELSELLSNNTPALELAKKINDRKSRYDEFQDDKSLINSLGTTGWKDIDLSETAASIQNEIFTILMLTDSENGIINTSESEVIKTQTIQTSSQVEDIKSMLDELEKQYEILKNDNKLIDFQNSFEIFRLIVYIALGFIIILMIVLYLLLKTGKVREYIIKQVLRSKRVELLLTSNKTEPYILKENDINLIAKKVLIDLGPSEDEIQTQPKELTKEEPLETSISEIKYLKGKSGRIFNRAEYTSENSFFKLFNESDNTAQFEFYGDEAEALAKRIFSEDICIIVSGSYQNAHTIETFKPGKVKRIGEKWEVIEPVEIKLI